MDYLQDRAEKIDTSFSAIKNDCLQVYDFSSGMRYSSTTPIEKHDVINIINSLKIIYDFVQIKQLRNEFAREDNYSQPINVSPLAAIIFDNDE